MTQNPNTQEHWGEKLRNKRWLEPRAKQFALWYSDVEDLIHQTRQEAQTAAKIKMIKKIRKGFVNNVLDDLCLNCDGLGGFRMVYKTEIAKKTNRFLEAELNKLKEKK